MSVKEFNDWIDWYRHEPYGNWPLQMLASTVANASGRYKDKLTPADFAPRKP